ncbi:MAG: NAD(+) synthase [Lachnospiraceae bacterium]|nr:NAD(+) synthase [Lachnospiraceae bacterium]
MDHGFRKAVCAAFDITLGNVKANTENVLKALKAGETKDADIVLFPELCLTGYTCGDMFLRKDLADAALRALKEIKDATKGDDRVISVGLPLRDSGLLFNCAALILNGRILALVPKTYLPNYNEFYEKRWFASSLDAVSKVVRIDGEEVPFGADVIVETSDGMRIGVEICEDLWVAAPPSGKLALAGANVILNPSASNELISKRSYRKNLVAMQSAACNTAYIYASAGSGESTTDVVYSGHCLIAECGSVKAENHSYFLNGFMFTEGLFDLEKIENDRVKMNSFRPRNLPVFRRVFAERCLTHELWPESVPAYPFVPKVKEDRAKRCMEILSIQAAGLATRLRKTGIKKSVIGISGGLDSTLALLVTREAYKMAGLPVSDIITVTMPGFGTTKQTKTSADRLMELIGTDARTIDITEACRLHMKDIGQPEGVYDVTYENIQARERTQILMDIANKEGGLVIGTGDLSELALGWCTYNGDHMSMYAVNVSIPKTLVKFIIETYAEGCDEDLKNVLFGVLDTVISPELLPPDENGNIRQSTEETIGKYDLHDFFLYYYVRCGFSRDKIEKLATIAFPEVSQEKIQDTLNTFMRRFRSNQFKRNCIPDGPKVGSVALSPRGDWRMPSDYQG